MDERYIIVRDYPVNDKNGEYLQNKCTVTNDELKVNEIVGGHLENAIDTIYVFKLVAEIKLSKVEFITKQDVIEYPLSKFIKEE